MKKVICLLSVGLLMVFLAACGTSGDNALNDHNVEVGKEVVETADAYLEGELSGEKAGTAIQELHGTIDSDEGAFALFSTVDRTLFEESVYELGKKIKAEGDRGEIEELRDKVAKRVGLLADDASSGF